MAENEQISPEEKLLKVIQNPVKPPAQKVDAGPAGNGASGAQVNADAQTVATPGEPSKTVLERKVEPAAEKAGSPVKAEAPKSAGAVQGKGKLKLAEKPEAARGADAAVKIEGGVVFETPKIGADVPNVGAGKIGGTVPVPGEKKMRDVKFGIKTVNKYLMVAAILVLCFVGWEAGSFQMSVRQVEGVSITGDVADAGADNDAPVADSGGELVPLDKVLSDFEKRPIVLDIKTLQDTVLQQTVITKTQVSAVQSEWQKYAKDNLKLMGKSLLAPGLYEAVVSDGKTEKLYFLKNGDKLMLDRQELEVKEIGDRFLNLTDGRAVESVE